MLKRIMVVVLFVILCIFISASISFASDITNDERQARELLEQYKDLRYLFDSGVNYMKYKDKYQDLYIKYRRFEENQKNSSYYNEAKKVMDVYSDIADYWGKSPGLTYTTYERYYKYLYGRYPDFKQRLLTRTGAFTYEQDVIWTIYSYEQEIESNFEKKLNETYSKSKL